MKYTYIYLHIPTSNIIQTEVLYIYMHMTTINEAINLKESKRGTWEGLWWGTEKGNYVTIF